MLICAAIDFEFFLNMDVAIAHSMHWQWNLHLLLQICVQHIWHLPFPIVNRSSNSFLLMLWKNSLLIMIVIVSMTSSIWPVESGRARTGGDITFSVNAFIEWVLLLSEETKAVRIFSDFTFNKATIRAKYGTSCQKFVSWSEEITQSPNLIRRLYLTKSHLLRVNLVPRLLWVSRVLSKCAILWKRATFFLFHRHSWYF